MNAILEARMVVVSTQGSAWRAQGDPGEPAATGSLQGNTVEISRPHAQPVARKGDRAGVVSGDRGGHRRAILVDRG